MRYLSEQFKEKQNELIRPALKLFFEVGSNVVNVINSNLNTNIGFDNTVAPVVRPQDCTNDYYYAVLGDDSSVDEPRRICAPDDPTVLPNHSVPYGVFPYTAANTEVMIGSNNYYENFIGIREGAILQFKGGCRPRFIRVEKYENGSWVTEDTIADIEGENFYFNPANVEDVGKFRRFFAEGNTSGHFQLNWIEEISDYAHLPIKFTNSLISSVIVDQETDLTSQTLPSYEMTVTCIDVNGTYKPGTNYWNHQFKCGTPCYFRIGYVNEQVPFMFGYLKEEPTYSENKLTFKVAVNWNMENLLLYSIPNDTLDTGDIVDNAKFKNIMQRWPLFNTYDVFHGADDEWGSETNYYGIIDGKESRQLVANALGCYIIADMNRFELYNTNDIQYRTFTDYLTRYEQSRLVMENTPKVADISVTRNEFTLSSEYVEVEADEAVSITTPGVDVTAYFVLPFYAYGKAVLVDAQSSDPDATVTFVDAAWESVKDNGYAQAVLRFTSDVATDIQPIVRFYEVIRTEYQETETVDGNASESYINDNILVANGYNAGKVKRVARFMSDVSNEYEIDVISNYAYEVGDVIRVETEKDTYKTCVITGLKFTFPGSKGHVTCRKIFAIEDAKKALPDILYATIFERTGLGGRYWRFTKAQNDTFVVGKFYNEDTSEDVYIIVGATEAEFSTDGVSWTTIYPATKVEDYNKHEWSFYAIGSSNTSTSLTNVYDLGTRHSGEVIDAAAWGGITLAMKLYEEQNMTSPLDYDNYEIIN